jgi:hypothetical protein
MENWKNAHLVTLKSENRRIEIVVEVGIAVCLIALQDHDKLQKVLLLYPAILFLLEEQYLIVFQTSSDKNVGYME